MPPVAAIATTDITARNHLVLLERAVRAIRPVLPAISLVCVLLALHQIPPLIQPKGVIATVAITESIL